MSDLSKFLTALAVAALMVSGPASSQDSGTNTDGATTEAAPASPASDLALGEAVPDPNAPGTPYVKEKHGDWQVRCIRTEDGKDPCQLYQLLKDQQGNTVSEISLFALPEGEPAAAGATIAVPLETLLTQQLTLVIDSGQPKRYPFSWCSAAGCFARVGFTAPEVAAFKAGSNGILTIVPVVAPDQKVELTFSLSGFTAGYDAVAASNLNVNAQ